MMSIKNGMRPVHPDEILRDELEELGMLFRDLSAVLDEPAEELRTPQS